MFCVFRNSRMVSLLYLMNFQKKNCSWAHLLGWGVQVIFQWKRNEWSGRHVVQSNLDINRDYLDKWSSSIAIMNTELKQLLGDVTNANPVMYY